MSVEEIQKFRLFNKLKSVYRFNSVDTRKESVAEHTWSALVLADFFLTMHPELGLDRLKVYEYIMYHDVVEIYAGDTPIIPGKHFHDKVKKEHKAAKQLRIDLPDTLSEKFYELYKNYEQQADREAVFAKAIDALDAEIHEMDYKQDWKGWTKEFLYSKKLIHFKDFPELEKAFIDITEYIEQEGYFDQH